jgi:hypothetical protein
MSLQHGLYCIEEIVPSIGPKRVKNEVLIHVL